MNVQVATAVAATFTGMSAVAASRSAEALVIVSACVATVLALLLVSRAPRGLERALIPAMGVVWAFTAGGLWACQESLTGALGLLTAVGLVVRGLWPVSSVTEVDTRPAGDAAAQVSATGWEIEDDEKESYRW